jgi:hypothetical protein
MTVVYSGSAVQLMVEPQLASWNRAGSPGQVGLANFLSHADVAAAPMLATLQGRLPVELIVGLQDHVPLTDGEPDLDNYLLPIGQRLGPTRIAAVFGRQIYGSSSLAIGNP